MWCGCDDAGGLQEEKQTFVGKVTSVRDGFCFMESRPGESNVYLPAQIADSMLINVGDIVTVQVGVLPVVLKLVVSDVFLLAPDFTRMGSLLFHARASVVFLSPHYL